MDNPKTYWEGRPLSYSSLKAFANGGAAGYLNYCHQVKTWKEQYERERELCNVLDKHLSLSEADFNAFYIVKVKDDGNKTWAQSPNKAKDNSYKKEAQAQGKFLVDSVTLATAKKISHILETNLPKEERAIVFEGERQVQGTYTDKYGIDYRGICDFLHDGVCIDLKVCDPSKPYIYKKDINRWHWQAALYQRMFGVGKYALLMVSDSAKAGFWDFDVLYFSQETLDAAWEEMQYYAKRFLIWGGDMDRAYSYFTRKRIIL
jgi:hypothetical protein